MANKSNPLLSLEASPSMAISLAVALGTVKKLEAANPPRPSPMMIPFSLRILLI